jgi:hypothetical protein
MLLAVDTTKNSLGFFDRLATLESLYSLSVLIIGILLPLYIAYYLRKNHKLWKAPTFRRKFDTLVSDLSPRNPNAAMHIVIHCYRRLAQITLIYFM